MADVTDRKPATVVAEPAWGRVLMWVGLPLVGAGAGFGLSRLVDWLLGLPWTPFEGPLRLLQSIPAPFDIIAPIAVGAVAGLVLAGIGDSEMLIVTVAGDEVTLKRGDTTRSLHAASVAGVFVEGKQLVLLGRHDDELAREKSDLAATALREAFTAHGYDWLPADPHRDAFRRWVEGTPDLPAGADALLRARSRALEKGKKDELTELRDELARLGVVVREDDKTQYWRRSGTPSIPS
ncbi:MAG: hypothetical protein GEV10_24980 [Streptosporangiales bacterium]|nr:hypothetical protein [Streptosporangiales bacterium]